MTIEQYPSSNNIATTTVWKYTATGSELTLSGYDNYSQALQFTAGSEQVYLNGVLLVRNLDYTPAANGLSITFPSSLAYNDFVQIYCYSNYSIASVASSSITGTIQNAQLSNSSITIGNQSISLGNAITTLTGTSISGSTNTLTNIPNSALSNSSIIINGNPISLGGTVNITTPSAYLTQKGGIMVGLGGGSVIQQTVGADGTYFVADSSKSNGVAYAGPNITAGRNYVINGGFDLNQRQATSWSLTGGATQSAWGPDHVYLYSLGVATSTYSLQSFNTGDISGYEPKNYLRVVTSSAGSTGDAVLIQFQIDGVRNINPGPITISFWARAASGTPGIGVETEQVFGTIGTTSTVQQTSHGSVTLSNSWKRYVITSTLPALTGTTVGQDGQDHINLGIWFSGGSSWGSRPNGIGIQSNTFDIWGVQLEGGSSASPFSKTGGHYNLESVVSGSNGFDGVLISSRYFSGINGNASQNGTNGWAGYQVAGKNQLINGNFDYWQKTTSQTVTGYNSADRWLGLNAGTTTISQETSDLPTGSRFGLKWVTGASNSYGQIHQPIETNAVVPLRGQLMVFSAWIKVAGGFTGSIQPEILYTNSVIDGGYSSQTTAVTVNGPAVAPTAWQRCYWTFIMPYDATGIRVGLVPTVVQASGVTVRFAQMQLEIGSMPSQFARAGGTLVGEQEACWRYLQVYNSPPLRGVMGSASAVNRIGMPLSVPMRTTPTSSVFNGTNYVYDGSTSTTINNTIVNNYCTANSVEYDLAASTAFSAAGKPVVMFNNGTGTLTLSAELN